MKDLVDAARRALENRGGEAENSAAHVKRMVLDVALGDRVEVVAVTLDEHGELKVATTAEKPDAYVNAALRTVAGVTTLGEGERPISGRRSSSQTLEAVRVSSNPPAPIDASARSASGEVARASLEDALTDVVVAVTRAGVREGSRAPAVQDAVERVIDVVGDPTPLGLARWVGLLKNALAAVDVDRVAWLLDGATRLSESLRSGSDDPISRRRRIAWLGSKAPSERTRVSDRFLIEVAREIVSGLERQSLERRYLVCIATGEVFREERVGAGPGLSVGPCPRILSVGLAEVDEGVPPRRVRLLQYAVSSQPSRDQWIALRDVALRSFRALAESYRESRLRYGGVAEPFCVIAPVEVEEEGDTVALIDRDRLPLPLARSADPSMVEASSRFLKGRRPLWVAGRLTDAAGTLMLVPSTVAAGFDGSPEVLRIS